jgi:hypothetical protein
MKKESFKIYLNTKCYQSVSGLTSKNFGIWKDGNQYAVTHLVTGYRIVTFPYLRQARTFVQQAEEIPAISSMTLKNATNFSFTMKEIINQIQKAERKLRS